MSNPFSDELTTEFDFTLEISIYRKHVRTVRVHNGGLYRIEPINPQKKKHRGRVGELIEYGDKGNILRMRFLDNNRVGNVSVHDLVEITPEKA